MQTPSFAAPQIYHGSQLNPTKLKNLLKNNPIPTTTQPSSSSSSSLKATPFHYEYGTAGFRYHHSLLPPIMIRMGILSSLRSASINGEAVGIMITASHNPEQDNGVKLSDSNGGMLPPNWETMATKIANADEKLLMQWIDDYAAKANGNGNGADINNNHPNDNNKSNNKKKNHVPMIVVHIGRDTRSHSHALSQLAIQTILAMGGGSNTTVIDHGCVTTPQLHYYVLRSNMQNMPNALLTMSSGIGFERDYMEGIIGTYLTLIATSTSINSANDINRNTIENHPERNRRKNQRRKMLVDCACGIGGLKIPILNDMLRLYEMEGGIIHPPLQSQQSIIEAVELIPCNVPGDGPLNESCGAEYVQKQQKIPTIFRNAEPLQDNQQQPIMDYVASLDGDADRIVFHYKSEKGDLVLLDGDKIAVLVSSFLQEELDSLATAVPDAKKIKCGVVQTAYANGSSTNYLKNNVKTNVVVAKTGVKFVHAAAHSNFDVGTYFEANGHGTVLFGTKFYDLLAKAEIALLSTCRFNRANIAWQRLRMMPRLVNQAVGDALSDLLLVDAILCIKSWTLQDWNQLYKDLPSRQCKVKVKDRSIIQTNDNETKATSPPSLQPALEMATSAMSKIQRQIENRNGNNPPPRSFVRPSGTENVVRIYAEASTQKDADALATEAAALVFKICNGVGDVPNFKRSNL